MKKTEKIRYEIDPHNRLICEKIKEGCINRFRTVLDGTFEIGKNNYIIYHVKKSQGLDISQQLKLRGNWSIDNEHNLVFTLDKWGNQIAGNKFTVQSELITAKDNSVSFALTQKDTQGCSHAYILRLSGRWQADEYNCLTFNIEKERGITNKITLTGAWDVNKSNELVYTYEKSACGERSRTTVKKKEKITKAITFKGYWDISEKYRVTYVLNKEIRSEFDFKVSVGKPIGRGLEYEVGAGVALSKKTITLFGKWEINPKIGLLFEMPSVKGKVNRIVFGGWFKIDKNLILEARLESRTREDLGIDVKLSRKIFENQGEAFIQALKSQKEVFISAGIGFRW
ncbi:MAG: hypothetical protein QMD94_04685 [Candidatus Omnitrophota bacterium]|nr:hypothetical protein [Candidatus Omnitrophota bacterium]